MSFAIYADAYKDPDFQLSREAVTHLATQGEEVIVSHPDMLIEGLDSKVRVDPHFLGMPIENLDQAVLDLDLYRGCKAVLSFGGDGTFLATAHKAYHLDLPLIGVNLGSLGFMTEIDPQAMIPALDSLMEGNFEVHERMMFDVDLMVQGVSKAHFIALNDIVISRGSGERILPVELFIRGSYTETIQCDGVIVSTPTGSTGYAMAAGGPICDPTMTLLQITPICPHSLHSRSYIIPDEASVTLALDEDYRGETYLSIDGRITSQLSAKDSWVHVRKARRPVKILEIEPQQFFRDLPEKLRGRSYIPGRQDRRE